MIDGAPEMIHLVSAADDRYLPHVAALIESVADSNRCEKIVFHFLHDRSVMADARDRLREMCDRHGLLLELLQPSDDLEQLLPAILRRSRYPEVIWYRTRLAELLPSLDRALYLDPDTLVLQDLRALWTTDVRGSSARGGATGSAPDGCVLQGRTMPGSLTMATSVLE